jgi:hypothetical protein
MHITTRTVLLYNSSMILNNIIFCEVKIFTLWTSTMDEFKATHITAKSNSLEFIIKF